MIKAMCATLVGVCVVLGVANLLLGNLLIGNGLIGLCWLVTSVLYATE